MAHSVFFKQFTQLLQQARRANLQAQGKPLASPERRRFLRNSTLGGAALASSSALSGCFGARTEKVVIIGGGLAGLNAAYAFSKAGIKADIYEARNRVGGRVRTVHGVVGTGLDTDLGGELINSDHDDMLALVEDFGLSLTSRLLPSPDLDKVGYFYGGRKRSEAEMADALRAFAAQLMADAELLDADWDTYAPLFDQQSLAAYLDQHSATLPSDPDIRDLIEGAVRVEYGVEPEDSSVLQLLYLLPVVDGEHVEVLSTSDEAYVINGGSETVVTALRNVLADQIHTHRALQKLEQTDSGYRLTFNRGPKVEAQYVILALPFTALRNVEISVELPETLSRFIQEVDLGRNEKIIAGVSERVWRTEQGFEIEAWNDQAASLLWDASLRQPNLSEAALTFFFGGNEVDASAEGTMQEQGQQIVTQYDTILPGLTRASNGKFIRTAWHKTPFIKGGYTNFKPGQYTELAEEWLYIEADDPEEAQNFALDNLVFAGEHTSDEYYGFMNGAAQSGRLAAQVVLQDFLLKQQS
jgi:monoamine oxidase